MTSANSEASSDANSNDEGSGDNALADASGSDSDSTGSANVSVGSDGSESTANADPRGATAGDVIQTRSIGQRPKTQLPTDSMTSGEKPEAHFS